MIQVAFVGRAVADPEIREKEEKIQATFRVAIKNPYKGGKNEATFRNCIAYGNAARYIRDYLKKGKKIMVFGIEYDNSYPDKDGNKRVKPSVIANNVEIENTGTSKNGSESIRNEQCSARSTAKSIREDENEFMKVDPEDVPFSDIIPELYNYSRYQQYEPVQTQTNYTGNFYSGNEYKY